MSFTFLSRDGLDIRPDWQTPSAGQVDDFTFEMTGGQGKGIPWKISAGPKRTVDYQFALTSRAQIGAFRRFVCARQGRLNGFWLPVYLRDYALTQDQAAGDTSLTFQKIGLHDALASFAQFKALVIADWSSIQCYQIASVSVSGPNEIVNLVGSLSSAVKASTVICGGLIWARLSEDEISYEFRDLGYCRANVGFDELPTEYDTAAAGFAPVYLYKFVRAGQTYRFCNWGVDLAIGGNTWTAADISHAGLKFTIDFVDDGPKLTVATDDSSHPLRALLDRYLLQNTTLDIYESDAIALTVPTAAIYSGRIDDVVFRTRGVIDATPSSLLYLGEQQGPRLPIQRICAHQTYDGFCGLNPATFTTAGTISALSSSPASVTATAFGAAATAHSDPNWFALGLVTSGQEQRFCVGASGNTLYLNAPFKFAIVGDAISARAGDDKRIGTCNAKFGNVANFLGAGVYAPNKNPQFEALQTPKTGGGKKG